MITLPTAEAPCRLPAKACRKSVSEAEPLVPPSAVTRLLKLVCRFAAAVLAEELEVVAPVVVELVLDVLPVDELLPLLEVPEVADKV